MKKALASVVAAFTLAACTELPDRVGEVGECVQIDAAAFAEGKSGGSWREIDLRGGGRDGGGAGANMRRCWPKVDGLNTPNRRCVQRNDLVVQMQTDEAITYYRIPARTTYMLYGEAGQARCQIVMRED